jgi:glycosyltransferase involved in cell wall biosynthesis
VSSRLPETPIRLARAARAKGAALVVNQNGVAYPGSHGAGWQKTNAPMASLLPLAAHVFYQSQFCKDTADRFLGVQPERWEILHNAVDTDRFVPASSRPERPLTLLLGGTYAATARDGDADTGARSPACHAWIARRRRPAMALVRTREPTRISSLTGILRRSSSSPVRAGGGGLHQRADILPRNTTIPVRRCCSSGSCGLPIVYSASGGVPELVGDDAGIGVPAEQNWDQDIPPDPAALAEGVLQVWSNRSRFSSAARQRAARFDVRPWTARHAEVFGRLAG